MPTRTTVLTHFDRKTPEMVRENLVAFKDLSLNAFYLPPGASLAFQPMAQVDRLHIVLAGGCTIRPGRNAFKVEKGAAVGIAAPGEHKIAASDQGAALITAAFRHSGDDTGAHREGITIFDLMGQPVGEAAAQIASWADTPGVGGRAILLTGLEATGPFRVHGRAHRVFVVLRGAISVETPDGETRVEALEVLVVPPAIPHRVTRRSGTTARVLVLSDAESADEIFNHVPCGAAFARCFLADFRSEGQIVLNADGTVASANAPAVSWLGLPEPPAGTSLFEYLPGTDAAWLSRLLRQPVTAPPASRRLTFQAEGVVPVDAVVVPYQGHGRIRRAVLTLQKRLSGAAEGTSGIQQPRRPDRDHEAFVAVSPAMRALVNGLHTLARGDAWAMIVGEPGVGRTTVASLLHHLGGDVGRRLVTMDCDAWSPERVPDALARPSRSGDAGWIPGPWLQQAVPGTLVLRHLQHLPGKVQTETLRRLEAVDVSDPVRVVLELSPQPCGGLPRKRRGTPFPTRGRFAWVEIPPLRARSADIPVLLVAFFSKHTGGHPPPVLSSEALEQLLNHAYPDNLRELERLVEALAALPVDGAVSGRTLRALLGTREAISPHDTAELPTLEASERALVRAALEQARGNKSEAARRLGIPRARLNRLVVKHGLEG